MPTDGFSRELSRHIGRLNNSGTLHEPISYSDVIGELSEVPQSAAVKILDDLEWSASSVWKPTSYILAAVSRLKDKMWADGWKNDAWRIDDWQNDDRQNEYWPQEPWQNESWRDESWRWTNDNIELDPTGKIKRQVGWLNKNADLQTSIFYDDVVEPLSQIDVGAAMKILRDLQDQAATVEKPTAYVIAAARRLIANASAGPAWAMDTTGKISRQVGWLNRNLELQDPIIFDEVIGPLVMIDVSSAMRVLKDFEEKHENVEKPTAFIIAAARRIQAKSGAETQHCAPTLDPTGKIARQVGWLNRNLVLEEKIVYDGVIGPLSLIDIQVAMRILKDFEDKADTIEKPMAYIVTAARRALADTGYDAQSCMDPSGKIATQVGWLNRNLDLTEDIIFDEVIGQLSQLDVPAAMRILKDFEERADVIEKPTAYIVAAAKRAASTMYGTDTTLGAYDPTGKIKRQIKWLNRNLQLQSEITGEVIMPLSALDVSAAMRILKDFEDKAETVEKPTAFIIAAARRAAGDEVLLDPTGKITRQVDWLNRNAELQSKIVLDDVIGPLSMLETGDALKILKDLQKTSAIVAKPTGYVIAAARRCISREAEFSVYDPTGEYWKEINALNNKGVLQDPITYDEVIRPLSKIGITAAMNILKDLQEKASTIANPTGYVAALARFTSQCDSNLEE